MRSKGRKEVTMAKQMQAMVFEQPGHPLRLKELPIPEPAPGEVLIKVHACGVCRTDLHVLDGELTHPKLPLILGHEIVGTVARVGSAVTAFRHGDRIGVPWLGYTCGTCRYCARGQENLCENALFTGYTRDGGYAEYTVADQRYCFMLPASYDDMKAAPLLCAGLIGYRSYRMAGNFERLGIYGFGAAAHLIAQVAKAQGKTVYAFTRPGDSEGQAFAREVGAAWTGDSDSTPPERLDAAIIFAPAGGLVPLALRAADKGGTVVCGGIHMSDIPSFPYDLLWEERAVRSVANLSRIDGEEFLAIAGRVPIKVEVEPFPLAEANEALNRLRRGALKGAAVLIVEK